MKSTLLLRVLLCLSFITIKGFNQEEIAEMTRNSTSYCDYKPIPACYSDNQPSELKLDSLIPTICVITAGFTLAAVGYYFAEPLSNTANNIYKWYNGDKENEKKWD